ncbi:hypothetical protein COOONC_25086, partial [Cooperia oncophora]
IRCIRSSRSRCGRNDQRPQAPEQVDRSGVSWSPDGRTGNRYFEANGRYYVEIQELQPLPDGKYHIVRRVVETGQPPNLPPGHGGQQSFPYPGGGQQPGGGHNAGAEISNLEEVSNPAHRTPVSNLAHPTLVSNLARPTLVSNLAHPTLQPGSSYPGQQPGSSYPGQQPGSSYPGQQPGSSYPGQQPGSSYPGQQPDSPYSDRDEPPSSVHAPDPGEPPSVPDGLSKTQLPPHYGGGAPPSHPQHYGSGDRETLPPIQYDETWYEPPGQGSYPRLLFSPHHGWREMTEDEVRRVRRIQPLADYDPLLSKPVDRLPDQNGRTPPGAGSS